MFEFSLEFSAPHTHTHMAQEEQKQARRAQKAQKSPEPRLAGFVISLIASWYGRGEGLHFTHFTLITHFGLR